ncbi:hypothetical protein [Candidatus Proelusimicrobium excrementi]|uniref:hypothetical protein n=1 Tax=Candidatus Proelusimicrobium excrementi TaxID=3416222 RepID=UPI003C87455F|nr:hypothetical protein [Elusimicrobiaceae bacterium]
MKELFSPYHFAWIIPLACFAIFIIAMTCYFLRREISAFFQKMFFPDTNRYIMPAGIISNVNTDKVQGPLTPERIAELIELEENPSKAAEAAKPAETKKEPAPKLPKEKKGFLRRFETNFRWRFRKLKQGIKAWFADFAGTEDAPANASAPKETVKIMAESASPAPLLLSQEKPETEEPAKQAEKPAENWLPEEAAEEEHEDGLTEEAPALVIPAPEEPAEEPIKAEEAAPAEDESPAPVVLPETQPLEQTKQEEAEKTEKEPAAPLKEDKPENPPQKEAKKEEKPFISDRTAAIAAILILACFVIFLSARVKLLGSLVMRHHIEMRNMQKQIEMMRYEQQGFKIIIHERTISPQKRYNK